MSEKRCLTGLFYGLVTIYLLGCAPPQPEYYEFESPVVAEFPIRRLGEVVRPEATRYLHSIPMGNYRDLAHDGIYEADSGWMEDDGVAYKYIVRGGMKGNLLSMQLRLRISDYSRAYRAKVEVLGMLKQLYRTIIPDSEYLPLEIQEVVISDDNTSRSYEWLISFEYYLTVGWLPDNWDYEKYGDPAVEYDGDYTIYITIRRVLN